MKALNVHPDEFVPIPASQLFGPVVAANNDPRSRIRPEYRVIALIQHQPELLNAHAQSLLHPLTLRDIPDMQENGLLVAIRNGSPGDVHLHNSAVRPVAHPFTGGQFPQKPLGKSGAQLLPRLRRNKIHHVLTEEFPPAQAVQTTGCGVDVQHLPL